MSEQGSRETIPEGVTVVPWEKIPVSEPVLPGDGSNTRRRDTGWTIYNPALISVVTGLSTSEAHRLLGAEAVRIDGRYAVASFDYIKPGDIIEVESVGTFLIGEREDDSF